MRFNHNFDDKLREFRQQLGLLETQVDDAVSKAVEKTAEDMAEIVRTNVVADSGIKSPSDLQSRYYIGAPSGSDYKSDGPPMSQERAWMVEGNGRGEFVVKPDPRVRQRAWILHVGHSGHTKPGSEGPMRFYVDGVPKFRQSIGPLDARQYWRKATQEIEQSDRFEQHLLDELEKKADEVF